MNYFSIPGFGISKNEKRQKLKMENEAIAEAVIDATCKVFNNCPRKQMLAPGSAGKRRRSPYSEAMQMICYVLRVDYGFKLTEIAKHLSLDHSTVHYGVNRVKHELDNPIFLYLEFTSLFNVGSYKRQQARHKNKTCKVAADWLSEIYAELSKLNP